jgi:aryl-alcohol dehydrogenase-like predicted oxidoreductase
MVTRTLGHSGPAVSRIGLGLAALGRPGYINIGHADDLGRERDVPEMAARACAVLDAARAGGVRYFDVARSYGRAEEFLAGWLTARRIDPAEVTVGSKWGYIYTAGWRADAERHEVKDHSLANLLRQAAESRALLSAHLDLYQIHSATVDSGVLDDASVLGELARLKAEGLRIGLSLSGPRQAQALRKAMEARVDGRRVFDVVQATWNVLEPSVAPALAEAHALGMGVIVKEALANGRLTDRGAVPELAAAAREAGATPDAVALADVLAQPWVDVVLSGAATVEQLESNLGALGRDVDAARFDGMVEDPESYWEKRSGLPWN